MRYTLHIARRYLLAKKEAGFITVISLISVIGVTVGVAALVVVLSVFNGFSALVTDILVGFDPHIRIQRTAETAPEDLASLDSAAASLGGVTGISPYVSGKGMLISPRSSKVVMLRGLDPDRVGDVSGVADAMVDGAYPDRNGGGIVLGFNLADKLGLSIGDTVHIVTATGAHDAVMNFIPPELHAFRVTGVYESDNKEYDGMYAFMTVTDAQRIFRSPAVHGADIRLADIGDAGDAKERLEARYGGAFAVQTWFDLHRDLYSVMQIERWTAFIILSLIIGVASFNLMGSLTMTVIEKTRDIGILKAMGARDRDIRSIFRFEAVIVGVTGSALGVALGLLVCELQVRYHLFALDPNVYIIPAIPVQVRTGDLIIIPAATLLLCTVASYFPSKRASALPPSDAVRWE